MRAEWVGESFNKRRNVYNKPFGAAALWNPVSKKESGFRVLGLLRYGFTEIYIANQQTRIKSDMTKDYFGE